jgi:serine/threonine protein kinase
VIASRIGTKIGGCELVELVSDGVCASVYRGRGAFGDVAIKVYGRAFVEARVTIATAAPARVRHAAVARLLDAQRTPDGAYSLISEWVDGVPLGDVVAERPPWPRVRALIESINAGLGAIHGAGIVHGDLKRSNVVAARDRALEAVIVDLSHSIVTADARITPAEVTLSSAPYVSPEQAVGVPLDGRSDLYALGVIFYELLTGVRPIDGGTARELFLRHCHEQVVPPRRRAPDRDIPQIAEDLCMWLLTKDRDARPSTRGLAIALGALASEPAARRTPSSEGSQ